MYLRILSSRIFEDELSKICSHSSGKGIKRQVFGVKAENHTIKRKGKIETAQLGERKEENQFIFCLLSDSFCGNVFKNPARYIKVKYPFFKYMSNNGGFKQTPDPVTFWGGIQQPLQLVRLLQLASTFVFWGVEPQDDWQQFTVGSAAKKVPCA